MRTPTSWTKVNVDHKFWSHDRDLVRLRESQPMRHPPASPMAFTKLVVDDLEAMADYYCAVFGLYRGQRDAFDNGVEGEPIEELSLTPAPDVMHGQLVLLKFLERSPAKEDGTILGFTTADLTALVERVEQSGGTIVSPVKAFPDHGIRVVFARDPEGHLNELVEMQT